MGRIWLSDKSMRKIKGAPLEDCKKHPKTPLRFVPEKLRPLLGGYTYACDACVEETIQKVRRDQAETKRRIGREHKMRRLVAKAKRDDLRRTAEQAQETLRKVCESAGDVLESAEERYQRDKDIRANAEKFIAHHEAQIQDLEKQIADLQTKLADVRQVLADVRHTATLPLVTPTEVFSKVAQDVSLALKTSKEAWDEAPNGFRKKHRDKKLMKRAHSLLTRSRDFE